LRCSRRWLTLRSSLDSIKQDWHGDEEYRVDVRAWWHLAAYPALRRLPTARQARNMHIVNQALRLHAAS